MGIQSEATGYVGGDVSGCSIMVRLKNQSLEHQGLENLCLKWLKCQGYRIVCDEVPITNIGVVDVIGTGKILKSRSIANRKQYRKQLGLNHELFSKQFSMFSQTILIEVKVSRSDFRKDLVSSKLNCSEDEILLQSRSRDKKWYKVFGNYTQNSFGRLVGKFLRCIIYPSANLHFIAAPPGLIRVNEVPAGWGLIEFKLGEKIDFSRSPSIYVRKWPPWIEPGIKLETIYESVAEVYSNRRFYGRGSKKVHWSSAEIL